MFVSDILNSLSGCFHGVSLSHGLYLSLFLAGLVGGFSHCAAMCGPFILSQTGHLTKVHQALLVPYHLGRITTYTLLAVCVASVLKLTFLFLPIRSYIIAPLLALAGTIFLVNAFPKLAILFPWAARIHLPIPQNLIESPLAPLSRNTGHIKQYAMGALLGFVPCGLSLAALMAASTAPSLWQSALAMFSFGLGTVPALAVLSFSSQFIRKLSPVTMRYITKSMMVWSSVWLFVLAGLALA